MPSYPFKYLVLALVFFWPSMSVAFDGMSMSIGTGRRGIQAYRVALQWPWAQTWCDDCRVHVGGFVEASLADLHYDRGYHPMDSDHLMAVAVSPVFRFEAAESLDGDVYPYAELGIGISWLSQSEISGRNLGLKGQFEDRVGFGIRFGENQVHDLNVRFMHFSNGKLGTDNGGFNVYYVTLGYWFPS